MRTKIFIALITFATITACYTNWNYPSKDACTTYVNNLIEQSQDFDGESIAKWLPGVWTEDSIFFYDEGWGAIEDIRKYKGDWNDDIAGGTNGEYTFGADGKGAYSYTPGYPPFDERVLSFAWQYEEADKTLVLSGEWNNHFKVSGFNGKYIILDSYDTVNKHNERQILKKVE